MAHGLYIVLSVGKRSGHGRLEHADADGWPYATLVYKDTTHANGEPSAWAGLASDRVYSDCYDAPSRAGSLRGGYYKGRQTYPFLQN